MEAGLVRPLETLRRFAILRDLGEAELEVLLRHSAPVLYQRGEYLFREGERGDALYLLTDGVVVAERVLDPRSGARKDLAIIPALSVVGEMALADDSPRSASVRAEIPSRALRIRRDDFEKLMAQDPVVASKLFRALFAETSQRLRDTNEELVAVYEVGRFVASAADVKEVGQAIVESLARRISAAFALVALYDKDVNQLRVAHAQGERADVLRGLTLPLDQGLAARCFDERKPILVERLLGATDPWESESMVLAPLVVRDRPVGLLLLGATASDRPFRIADLSLTAAVCNISAPILLDAFVAGS